MIKMKDSGVEWIGEIPANWNLVQTKRYFYNKKQIVGDAVDEYERLALTMNGVIKRSKDDNEGLQPEKFEGYQILRKNEIVFKLIDLENVKTSRVGLSPYTGLVSPAYIVISNDSEDNRFYYYWFMFMYHNEVFNHLGGAGVRSALNAKDVMMLPIPEIDKTLQKRLADYLDEKCIKIDKIIEKQQSVIEKLKEYRKNFLYEVFSGKTQFGTEYRLGDIAEYRKGPFGSAITISMFVEKSENTYKVYEQKNAIQHDYLLGHYYITKEKYDSLEAFQIKPNDIIVSCAGTIGECYILPTKAESGVINQALMRIRTKKGFDVNYVCMMLESILPVLADEYSNGSAIKNIPPFSVLKKCKIRVPELEDQKNVMDNIFQRLKKIDLYIEKKESMLERFNSYKKSLIYEVVTGKKVV